MARTPTSSDTDIGRRFAADGFVFPQRVLATETARALAREVHTLRELWGRPGVLDRPLDDYLRANFHVVSRLGVKLARLPAIVDAVEELIGPDILCWMTELIIKEPSGRGRLSMHQDLTYWGFGATDEQVTAWLALSDAYPDNGGMTFVRGSHRLGQLDHRDTYGADNLLSRGQTIAADHDEADEVPVELMAGEMSLHHGLMVHGSGANTSAEPRIGVVIRYLTPNVRQQVGRHDYAMVIRGVNRTGNFMAVGEPDHDFSAHAVRLWHEIEAAQMPALNAGADGDFSYTRPAGPPA